MTTEIFPSPLSPTTLRRAETETTKVINLPKTISDLNIYYANSQGKVIIDPLEAEAELAQKLKLDKTGRIILWPQPSHSPDDPQNWSSHKKLVHLIILTMASFVPDFCSAIGIASLFSLAKEFDTTPGEINNLTSKIKETLICFISGSISWSIFLLGPGGILAVIFVKRYGRLPVLFWSQLIGLGFLIGCAAAPTLPIFAAMRCLNAFFSTAPQVMGLYVVNDLYPFHLQARMVPNYTMSIHRAIWVSGIQNSSMYVGIVVILIALFMEETIYDRFSEDQPVPGRSFKARFESLIGITGFRTAGDRDTWRQAITPMIQLLARPHLMGILIYLGAVFGFGIGINVTNVVFVLSPPPFGFGLTTIAASSLYATPVIAVFIGEIMGRYINDAIAKRLTHRNSGVFEPEMRLWTLYIGLPLYVGGLVLLGAAFQEKLSVAAIVFGWGLAEVATMVTTVACSALSYSTVNYTNNTFPFPGEISALLNQSRVLGGFAVPFFQVKWASSRGALETFGCEAAIDVELIWDKKDHYRYILVSCSGSSNKGATIKEFIASV
ncbi:uncharacterized protein MELLADRAFT_93710 [Melampsora larici-populina 98AG31]|uniref:Major facilitator superfamily (MFS) profile domain-containing protein n=1 Tax=Melampsora larici-populina (strain 98AG31 / pathotype 3-4-7) TaxID=747676 RepID=F4S4Z8_MELLP|nr:uncharacterized protein MELLADRAFT_93710 [Melampsora larici-populina 98AG31]EGG00293.1 hypothetical protein MELLADRAFT_93710 [Melampsora larici-populina 98AG31]